MSTMFCSVWCLGPISYVLNSSRLSTLMSERKLPVDCYSSRLNHVCPSALLQIRVSNWDARLAAWLFAWDSSSLWHCNPPKIQWYQPNLNVYAWPLGFPLCSNGNGILQSRTYFCHDLPSYFRCEVKATPLTTLAQLAIIGSYWQLIMTTLARCHWCNKMKRDSAILETRARRLSASLHILISSSFDLDWIWFSWKDPLHRPYAFVHDVVTTEVMWPEPPLFSSSFSV